MAFRVALTVERFSVLDDRAVGGHGAGAAGVAVAPDDGVVVAAVDADEERGFVYHDDGGGGLEGGQLDAGEFGEAAVVGDAVEPAVVGLPPSDSGSVVAVSGDVNGVAVDEVEDFDVVKGDAAVVPGEGAGVVEFVCCGDEAWGIEAFGDDAVDGDGIVEEAEDEGCHGLLLVG